MTRTFLIAVALTGALVLTGCSGEEKEKPTVENTAQVPSAGKKSEAVEEPDDDAVEEYFGKLATNNPTQVEQAIEFAAPGSFAAGYALHRANVMATNLDHGMEVGGSEVSVENDTAELCQPDDPTACGSFADFSYNHGKLAGFTIDGIDVSDRLVLGDGTIVKSKNVAGFELLSAYQSVTDDTVTAVFRFHSYDRPIDTSYVATYRDPTGRQVQDIESLMPSTLAPDSNQLALANFPRSAVGGEFILKFATGDDREPLIVEEVAVSSADRD